MEFKEFFAGQDAQLPRTRNGGKNFDMAERQTSFQVCITSFTQASRMPISSSVSVVRYDLDEAHMIRTSNLNDGLR